jgi:nitrite reductase/ring-hydroxylating ferredoxin subunit
MQGFTKIGSLGDFKDRRPRDVAVNGLNVVVVHVDGDVFAFENSCPHQHFSLLHQGSIEGCTITCPMHGWTFDMKSGSSTNGNGRLRKVQVKCVDDSVWIGSTESDQSFPLFD